MAYCYYAVRFHRCGAESHPAFVRSLAVDSNHLELTFPVNRGDMRRSKDAQLQWAKDKIKHLQTFAGSYPTLVAYNGATVPDQPVKTAPVKAAPVKAKAKVVTLADCPF